MMVGAIDQYYRGREQVQRDEGMRSCGMAAGAIMLLAQSMGYATCPMDGSDFEAVGKLIHLPEDHEIVMFVALGKPAKDPYPTGGSCLRLKSSSGICLAEDQFSVSAWRYLPCAH